MKTDIRVLWIDDNRDFVEATKPQIENWIETHGFGLDVRFQKTSSGVIDMLKKQDIAFVILDYHLGRKDGDTIIREIREAEQYQDIVFYSQGLDRSNFGAEDGVFFVDRADLEHRITNLLELKVRAACDFATFRGWFVADSIELEIMLGRILIKCFGDQQALFKSRVLDYEGLFDFYKKHQVLSGILKDKIGRMRQGEENYAALVACKKILDNFPDDIIHPRNGLAHQPDENHESGKKIKTRAKNENKEILATPVQLSRMRKTLRTHYGNLSALEALV